MSWKQRVSIVVLVLFTGLPVSGTVCAMMCDAAAAGSDHHGSATHCVEAAHASSDARVGPAPGHDCDHDDAIRQAASPVPQRVELKAAAIALSISAGHTSFSALPLSVPPMDEAGPPGTAPRTTIPLVLRV